MNPNDEFSGPNLGHRIALDVMLIETEQFQTPYLPYFTPGYIAAAKCLVVLMADEPPTKK
jgi:hypothetical protein